MLGQALHQLDALLCRHVRDNVCWNLDHEAIARRIGKLDPRLADYVKQGHPHLNDVPSIGEYLLSEDEFDDLIEAVSGLPSTLVDMSLDQTERLWLSDPGFFRNTPLCTAEIRSALAPAEAERWAKRCNSLIERLTSDRLLLAEGIDFARQLALLIRQYLFAIGEVQLVPPPNGAFPTPTNPTPTLPFVDGLLDEKLRVAVQRMRQAIRQHERGPNATPAALIKLAHINTQIGRTALRVLEEEGEYLGHGRSKAE